MPRTIIALVAAIVAAASFLVSRAEACISCEYVPSVVNSGVSSGSKSYQARPNKSRSYSAARERRSKTVRKREVERGTVAKKHEPRHTTPAPQKSQATNTAGAAAATEHSTISTARGTEPATAPERTAAIESATEAEHSTISTGATDRSQHADAEPAKAESTASEEGCKKFFPSVGLTLSVHCE